MGKILHYTTLFLVAALLFGSCGNSKEVKWTTFEKASAKKGEKMYFIELYTSWCGWCRRMENYTFNDPLVAKYLNKNFHCIRFNAEDRRPINFADKTYRFNPADTRRGRHELAAAMMLDCEKQGYPTIVFFDENMNLIQAIPGYITARDFEAIMHYFGDGAYKTTKWEEFVLQYKIGDAKYSDVDN